MNFNLAAAVGSEQNNPIAALITVGGSGAGAGSGVIYVVIKSVEYVQLFTAGYNLRTDTFYFFYFFTTFFHMMHVVLGMVILLVVARRWQRGVYQSAQARRMAADSAASYLHMVGLVWLMLFPLLYMLP